VQKKGVVRHGQIARSVHALCGTVSITRQRYRCPGCGGGFYARSRFFDSFGHRLITETVWSFALQLAVYLPYEQTCRRMAELLRVELSPAWLQRELVARGCAESEHQGEAAHNQATFRSLPDPSPPSVSLGRQYVEMDGCFVHRWRQKASFELKVGNVFSDPILVENGTRKWIEHKEYVGYFGDSETFGERLFSCGERWGVSDAEELYVLGDGASWIRSLHSQYFPHGQLILDWWHLQKAVRTTLGSLVPEESERQRTASGGGDEARGETGTPGPVHPQQSAFDTQLRSDESPRHPHRVGRHREHLHGHRGASHEAPRHGLDGQGSRRHLVPAPPPPQRPMGRLLGPRAPPPGRVTYIRYGMLPLRAMVLTH